MSRVYLRSTLSTTALIRNGYLQVIALTHKWTFFWVIELLAVRVFSSQNCVKLIVFFPVSGLIEFIQSAERLLF